MSLSTNVSNLATRIATEVKAIRTLVNGNAADLSSLTTTDKTNLVSAINELKGLIENIDLTAIISDTNISTSTTFSSSEITGWFGSGISDMAGSTVMDRLNAVNAKVGILDDLTTDEKMSIVAAINELQSEINNIDLTGLINDSAVASDSTWSSFKINGLGSSLNNPGELVKRNSTGGFEAGAITASSVATNSIDGGNMPLSITSGMGAFQVQAGSVELVTYGQGGIVLNPGSGDVYIGSNSAENEAATVGYVDTAEADAVTTANAYTDSRINDGVTSSTKTWSSSKIESEISGAVSALVDGAPALLDTLNELAAAINDDASFASTITTALATKADDADVVKLTGDQSIDGIKTFTSAPDVPDSAFAIAKITGLQAALDAKASTANVGDTTVNYVATFEAGLV